jgi:hypothetical protein
MVPAAVTQAVIDDAHAAITAWAMRHGWVVAIDRDRLTLAAVTTHPAVGSLLIFHAELDGFPAIPPAWTCRNLDGQTPKSAYPAPPTSGGHVPSIFHTNGLLCAHWNRLAYAALGGIHSNWTDLANWKTTEPGSVRGETFPDMLAAIRTHLASSPGMQS